MNKHRRKKSKRSHRSYRRNPSRAGEYDERAARELELYIDNDGQLHRSSFVPIIANLVRKMKKGTYRPDMAAKLWAYHIKRGADKYVKEFGSRGDTVSDLGFNKATRDRLAILYEEANRPQVEDEAGTKYKSNPSRRRRHRRNPAPSRTARVGRLTKMRDSYKEHVRRTYTAADMERKGFNVERRLDRLEAMIKRASAGDKSYRKLHPIERKAPSLDYIERATHEHSPHFFDRKTLKYFGQRKSDFKVMRSKKSGRVFIAAPSRTHRDMYTIREFTGSKLKVVSDPPTHFADVRDWVNRQ